MREGDVLTSIDGAAASRFSLDEIYQMMKQPSREYRLGFRRGDGTRSVKIEVEIETRRLI